MSSPTPGIKGLRRVIDAVVDASERVAQKRLKTDQPLGSLIKASGRLNFEIDESGDILFIGKARGLKAETEVDRTKERRSDGHLEFEVEVWCSPRTLILGDGDLPDEEVAD